MKIIITGHTGQVGSRLLYKLVKTVLPERFPDNEKHNILCVSSDRNSSPETRNLIEKSIRIAKENVHIDIISCNLENRDEFMRLIPFTYMESPDVLFSLASIISVPYSMDFPAVAYNNNVTATSNSIYPFAIRGLKRVITASSCAVYGSSSDGIPKKEDAILPTPKSPYTASKIAQEDLTFSMTNVYKDMNAIILRYFDIYGPRQRYLMRYTPVIRKFLQEIYQNRLIRVDGTGKQERMFTYIDDIVHGNICAMLADDSACGEVYNISSGELGRSNILNVIEKIQEYFTDEFEVEVTGVERPGDGSKMLGDIAKAKTLLGFEPKYGFDEGMKKTCKWFKEYIRWNK